MPAFISVDDPVAVRPVTVVCDTFENATELLICGGVCTRARAHTLPAHGQPAASTVRDGLPMRRVLSLQVVFAAGQPSERVFGHSGPDEKKTLARRPITTTRSYYPGGERNPDGRSHGRHPRERPFQHGDDLPARAKLADTRGYVALALLRAMLVELRRRARLAQAQLRCDGPAAFHIIN